MNLECSPSFDKLRTVTVRLRSLSLSKVEGSKVEPLGEPYKVGCLFPAKGGDPADKKFSAGSIGQVKLKLDTPARLFPSGWTLSFDTESQDEVQGKPNLTFSELSQNKLDKSVLDFILDA